MSSETNVIDIIKGVNKLNSLELQLSQCIKGYPSQYLLLFVCRISPSYTLRVTIFYDSKISIGLTIEKGDEFCGRS